MRLLKVYGFLFLIAVPGSRHSWSQDVSWELLPALTGGRVNVLRVLPDDGSYLAGTTYGVFAKSRAEDPWHLIGLDSLWITDIAVAERGRLVVGTFDGLYEGNPSGTEWQTLIETPVHVDPVFATKNGGLVIGCDGCLDPGIYVYVSSDGGSTWQGIPSIPPIRSIADRSDGSLILTGDDGTWKLSKNLTSAVSISKMGSRTVHVNSRDDIILGALAINASDEPFHTLRPVYRSKDDGQTWENHVIQPGDLWADTVLFRSNTELTDAEPLFSDHGEIMSVLPGNDGRIWIGTIGSGIHVSEPDGRSWSENNNGLTRSTLRVIGPDRTGFVRAIEYVAGGGRVARVHRTHDHGISWHHGKDIPWVIMDLAVHPDGSTYATYHGTGAWYSPAEDGVLYTTDGFKSWERRPIPVLQTYSLKHVAISPEGILYAGSYVTKDYTANEHTRGHSTGYVHRSKDGGATWQTSALPVTGQSSAIAELRVDSDGIVYALTNRLVLRSTDHGETWQVVYDAGPTDVLPGILEIDAQGALFLIMRDLHPDTSSELLFYSNNQGTTWRSLARLDGPPTRDLAISSEGALARYTEGSIAYSVDGAQTWYTASSGLPELDLGSRRLMIDDGGFVYVSTWEHGLYRSSTPLPRADVGRPKVTSDGFRLEAPWPNPAMLYVSFSFTLTRDTMVTVTIFDTLGRRIRGLVDETLPAGRHRAAWDATSAAAGTYFVRLNTPGGEQTRTVVLVR